MFAADGRSILFGAYYLGASNEDPLWRLVRYWPGNGAVKYSAMFPSTRLSPDVSPDGRLVAFNVSTPGGPEIRFARKVDGKSWRFNAGMPADGPSFSPDGQRLAYLGDVDGVFQVFMSDIDGSNRRQITDGAIQHYGVVFSPDNTKLAFYERTAEENPLERHTNFFVYDLKTGEKQLVPQPGPFVELGEWPRQVLFKVQGFNRRDSRLRVRVYGPGGLRIWSRGRIIGIRKIRAAGTHLVAIRRSKLFQGKRQTKTARVRVVFRPKGALPGSRPFLIRR
ncbi:MAG: TolB protein [Actinomycetota bacterium]|nr:TolB protein [Actinomycetota bacterium]